MISMHTSPLALPGSGDAGGMNVYIDTIARKLADRGVAVEVFTRATSSEQPPVLAVRDGYLVHHVPAGPFTALPKEELPGQLCAFLAGMMRAEAHRPPGWFDVVHSHYWLSGQAGWVAASRWDVPLVHSMHTMGRVKNASLAAGDAAEPAARLQGEDQVVGASDLLVANTAVEADELVRWYGAAPERTAVVHPGVDLEVFAPGDRAQARRQLGLPADRVVLLFAGRVQPLKAPDLLVRAVGELVRRDPHLARSIEVVVCGGPSGSGLQRPQALVDLARQEGVEPLVRFVPPTDRATLAQWFRAADVTVVPSYSESFGLVALESQACGTPVAAARVGGLPTAVAHGRSGILVDGHDPQQWAAALEPLVRDESLRARLGAGARPHARRFSWDCTAGDLIDAYAAAADRRSGRAGGRLLVPA
jgi:D-inositol-3-phosphate glycosyltransferase